MPAKLPGEASSSARRCLRWRHSSPLNYDHGTEISLETERWDGLINQYTATSNGSAHYNLFGANPEVIEQLKGQVTDACLSSLLNQVI